MSEYLTREQAATFLSVHPKTLDRWFREGRVERYKVAGIQSVRYKEEDLRALLIPDTRNQ